MSRNNSHIRVQSLSKSFNGQLVLDDISLDVLEGEIMVILGESGEGKSVLLKHLIGLLRPDKGSVEINGRDVTGMSETQLLKMRKEIGYLFQEGALFDSMTVEENLAFPLEEHTDLEPAEISEKISKTLAMVGLKDVEKKYPVELSGGMKKRAALARSIILDSRILFCDEPTSGLDPIRSRDITDLIRNITRAIGSTTVITSHDIENSLRIADRLALLHEKRILAVGTPAELERSQQPYVRQFLGRRPAHDGAAS